MMSSLHPSSWPCRWGLGLIRGSSPPHSSHPLPIPVTPTLTSMGGMWRGSNKASQPHIICLPPKFIHSHLSPGRPCWGLIGLPAASLSPSNPFNPQGQRSFLNGLLPGPLSGFSCELRGKCSLTPGPRELLVHPACPYFPTTSWTQASGLQPARASSRFWKLYLLSFPKTFTPGGPSPLHPSSSSGSEHPTEPALSALRCALMASCLKEKGQ